ncbi:hypothetical protein [Roseospira navarrensis]|uniref:Uncharacterized protein n=1 Tax=Roseospira navarrensis TaxID=140058 RepID=A0A7X1ZE92_9PROT|nr:hypothetical protein [Roseospira navarrensis]MQX36944.1 hypothetical protein [Roseospira navarrensis]
MRNEDQIDTRDGSTEPVIRADGPAGFSDTLTQAATVLRTGALGRAIRPADRKRLQRVAAFLDSLAVQ